MAEKANIMTHQDFAGKKPTINLRFPVIWKNTGPEDDDVRENGMSVISTPNVRDWESFKRDLFTPFEHSIDDVVTYIDSDDDQIPIESQCEFDEALRIATARATRQPRPICLYLVVDRGFDSKTRNKKSFTQNSTPFMPPIDLNDAGHGCPQIQRPPVTDNNVKEPELSNDDGVPKWFTGYIQKIKEEIVAEVSTRVTKAVMEALHKKHESRYDSGAASNSEGSDSEDGGSDELDGKIGELDLLDEVKSGEASLRSSHDRCRHSRRRNRNRNSEKQHKKLNKSASQAPNTAETSSPRCYKSSSGNGRRNEKLTKMRVGEELLGAPSAPGNSEQQNTSAKTSRDPENVSEGFDTPYRRMIASGIRQMSFTPVDSTDLPDVPILKLRLANSCSSGEIKQNLTQEKSRMGCSVTGNDIFERSNDRVADYCTLSDSDNISIISDVSHNSDLQRISNSFEIIVQQSMNIRDESDDERELMITMDLEENGEEKKTNEEPEVGRDSSSFEFLSEPPSPPLSIHMDEHHFSPAKNETKNYNINDPMTSEKREIQDKMESSTLVIDALGQIHENLSIEIDTQDAAKLIFPKRTDGSYSFVAETLPGLTKESVVESDRPDPSADEKPVVIEDSTSAKEPEITEEKNGASNYDEETFEENSNRAFHESTQSFHSHTASQSRKERQDFDVYSSMNGAKLESSSTTSSHIFVDHNASKGLGDSRQSSPKKQDFCNQTSDDFKPERPKSWRRDARREMRRQSNSSNHANSSRRNKNSSQTERPGLLDKWLSTPSRRVSDFDFPLSNVQTIDILPESLVFGAVHVAASAYTTARRVCDKILTAQTRKPADQSKFGRR